MSPQKEARRIVIYLEKGGVGKTMTAVQLAAALAKMGYKVTLIDLDRQSHCKTRLGLDNVPAPRISLGELLLNGWDYFLEDGEKWTDIEKFKAVAIVARENLFLIPGSKDLAKAMFDLTHVHRENWSGVLGERFKFLEKSGMDFIIMDTNPSWNPLSANALFWGKELVYPVKTGADDLKSVAAFQGELNNVRELRGGDLELLYVLPTMFDKRLTEANDIVETLKRYFSREICEPIPLRTRLAECGSRGKTIFEYDPECASAEAYQKFAERIAAGPTAKKEDEK